LDILDGDADRYEFFQSIPAEVRLGPELKFHFFRMARKNWQEQYEVMRKWAEAIKAVSLKIYEENTMETGGGY